jgi:hypothetical protein
LAFRGLAAARYLIDLEMFIVLNRCTLQRQKHQGL